MAQEFPNFQERVLGLALVVVVPTVDTVAEAIQARDWTYFPPLGRRSNGGGQAFDAAMWGGVPGGYRNTANDNIVLVLMIETLEGLKNAAENPMAEPRNGMATPTIESYPRERASGMKISVNGIASSDMP